MRKLFFLVVLTVSAVFVGRAQSFNPSNLEIGGSVGFQFGGYTIINVAPQLGYRLNPYFTVGAGVSYTYYKDDRPLFYDYKASYFGMNVFGLFYPVKYVVLSVQPEASRMWRTNYLSDRNEKKSEFVPSVLIGGGLRFGPVTAMLHYDLIKDDYSPYSKNIFYSIGYTFGL